MKYMGLALALVLLGLLASACKHQIANTTTNDPRSQSGASRNFGGDTQADIADLERLAALVWTQLAPRIVGITDEATLQKTLGDILQQMQAQQILPSGLAPKAKEALVGWLVYRFAREGKLHGIAITKGDVELKK